MGFVSVFAVGLAAFRYPNKLWASFFFSLTLGAMVIGTLGAIFHRGLPQKFWLGYAICGCLDLLFPRVAAPEQTAFIANYTQTFGLAGGFGGPSAPVNAWEFWTKIDS